MLKKSPFLQKAGPPIVSVAKGNGPYSNTREALSRIDLSPAKNKKVLLKPNAGRIAPPGKGIITDPHVVAAAIDSFKEVGATVAVGESPILGVKTYDAFDAAGITEVAEERNVKLIDMDERPAVKVDVPEGLAIDFLKVCPEVLEYDIVVSMPVMKTHMHTGVSLSIKNMKGCLWRRSKVELHMLPPVEDRDEKPIDIAITDLSGILRPHLSIIDGTIGMEGLGPSAGIPKPLDVVVAGTDAFSADAVACRLMGIKVKNIPHLRMAGERGFGIIDVNKIDITPANWQDWVSPFTLPPENLSFEFPNINVLDSNSCSACQSTLLLFLKHYKKILFDYIPSKNDIQIAIGKGHKELPQGTLCIGNCTAQFRKQGIFVSGCPPVSSEIIHKVTGKPAVDIMDGRGQRPEEE